MSEEQKIRFVMTCGACPEQYDAFIGEEKVGYLRLRHGHFTVTCPDYDGQLVYDAQPKGDGVFDANERDYYLRFAADAITRWKVGESFERPPAPEIEYERVGEPWDSWE